MTATDFYVYFVRGAADLETAAEAFPRHDLAAERTPSALVLTVGELRFEISLDESEAVPAAAAEAGKNTEFEAGMAACTAGFKVRVSDLERALDEINTIMELQGALQDCCGGFVFLPWNHGIIEPWVADDGL
ncbi:hypothetical protein IV498_12980 [Paenarthrobacter sp. Z7-10]|uniref:hypothetical protein n=1 Tax=Paenarthrobacter sp. Z7-10 TaxID=2787635 RepID=UPI0022A9E090|nr:hypothetical protein [Paenarthrobacter sp. Z7-10]MCZ2404069.1 hypothetical protein [Paenarthrobacter sp. Z7-10]